MKREIMPAALALLAALFLAAPPVAAAGLNLGWDDCTLGTPAVDKAHSCIGNLGQPFALIGSVDPPFVNDFLGVEAVLEVQVDGQALPDWWRFESGSCRSGALALDLETGFANPPYSCPEPWGGAASGALNYTEEVGGVRYMGRIRVIAVLPHASPATLDPGISSDWYLFRINILRQNTTTCPGCLTPACIVLNSMKLVRPAGSPGGDHWVVNTAVRRKVTWQGGCTPVSVTPVTWGQVKGMYR